MSKKTMNVKYWTALFLLILFLAPCTFAKDKKKNDPKKDASAKVVDSGSFGIFVSGRRVATETFSIKQIADGSITSSDIKMEGGNEAQHSDLQLTPNGDLIRYDWKETGPEKGETTLVPTQQFLMQQVRAADKSTELPYLMPSSAAVLDDYFFSHRELLLWRYLGNSCRPKEGEQGCTLEKSQYAFVVPRQRSSGMATLSYVGREMVSLHGAAKELSKFTLSSDFGDWVFFLDENNKLVKILVVGETTEVIRD